MSAAYPLAFGIGLLSALHCMGMCGGIVGALSYSLPAGERASSRRLAVYLVAYNLGRIASYALAGALLGGLGAALAQGRYGFWLADAIRMLGAIATVGIGLHIAGWLPRLALLERIGVPLWRRLEPLGRRLLPVRTLTQAALFGAVWGWLPCGLVYAMLIGSPAQGGAAAGALYMALFGAGTLPTLLAAGMLAGRLYRLAQDKRFRTAAGMLTVLIGLSVLYFQGYNR